MKCFVFIIIVCVLVSEAVFMNQRKNNKDMVRDLSISRREKRGMFMRVQKDEKRGMFMRVQKDEKRGMFMRVQKDEKRGMFMKEQKDEKRGMFMRERDAVVIGKRDLTAIIPKFKEFLCTADMDALAGEKEEGDVDLGEMMRMVHTVLCGTTKRGFGSDKTTDYFADHEFYYV